MIHTVLQIALLRLWNNKQELLLTFVVPILFFSIFALIFGRGIGAGTAAIAVAIVDDDQTPLSNEIARRLKEQPAVQIDDPPFQTSEKWPLDALTRAIIRSRGADIVVHLSRGMERSLRGHEEMAVHLFSEGTNPVGRQIVQTALAQVVSVALAKDEPAGPHPLSPPPSRRASAGGAPADRHPNQWISVETTDVFAGDKQNPKIAMYAAGIAVMFLLFSATGAGGSLLEEQEAGTLDRLLTSRLGITELLAGKWLFITCLGCVQLTVMFAWAQLAFQVDLIGHLPGFAVMTLCTAAATASLALCLAVFCHSRTQLNALSIVLILTMSALGGSMVPRYIMSEEIQRWGQLTFNAWALDGFKKVFWYDLPLSCLGAEVAVLLVMAVALAFVARVHARRWAAN